MKLGIYAECGVPEYWIVNLKDRRIEVFTEPEGLGYRTVRHAEMGDAVSPISFPDITVRVADVIK